MDVQSAAAGVEALQRLTAADPPLFLSPSEEIAKEARVASQFLFSAFKPYSSSSNCLSQLLTDGFDAEQIWPQIEAQTVPSMKIIKTQFRKFVKIPEELEKQFTNKKKKVGRENGDESKKKEDVLMAQSDDDDDEEEEEGGEDEEGSEEEEDGGDEEEEEGDGVRDVEDKFLKIKELERYLEADEAREYGVEEKEKKRKRGGNKEDEYEEEDDEDDDDDEEEDEDDDEEDEIGLMEMDDDLEDDMENAKYDDFFAAKKKINPKRTSKLVDEGSDDFFGGKNKIKPKKTSTLVEEGSDDSDLDERPNTVNTAEKKNLSTHEKEQEKLRSQIEKMEKANLEPKDWMMQGEVTAAKRGRNSALEVDLDFEHNVRPPPVITEEVTASLEELIQKRILEANFNDVRKPPSLPTKAPKEKKEMDENKSKKGLAEVYEEEYVQKTGLVSAVLSFSDEQKKEASTLFKKLCLKLDALSHFHFTPKPVIEDMSIQANVPALAMEEIAPMAVSDAAMLAPEEVFSGKGDIKEEVELTQAERKRRRANKKRKFKAESVKRIEGKAEKSTTSKDADDNEAS